MNIKNLVLAIIAIAVVLMLVFLPTFTFHEQEGLKAGYHFILSIPDSHQLNGPLLFVQWFGVLLFAAILWTYVDPSRKKRRTLIW